MRLTRSSTSFASSHTSHLNLFFLSYHDQHSLNLYPPQSAVDGEHLNVQRSSSHSFRARSAQTRPSATKSPSTRPDSMSLDLAVSNSTSAAALTYIPDSDPYTALKETRSQVVSWARELERAGKTAGIAINVTGTLDLASTQPDATLLHLAPHISSSAVGPTYEPNPDTFVNLRNTRDHFIAWVQELRRVGEAVGIAIDAKGTLELAGIGTTKGEEGGANSLVAGRKRMRMDHDDAEEDDKEDAEEEDAEDEDEEEETSSEDED
ncbi:hypothetical protein A4X13_0g2123 [Tilletia indica]|uniref:Uncharacterized protein n=1 Tax=Tilletia indica TaxID=43049 RepID=A0A177TGR6_9BASI|nr:hypothetical protein A4X13_0g2123 [Tilletia indica]